MSTRVDLVSCFWLLCGSLGQGRAARGMGGGASGEGRERFIGRLWRIELHKSHRISTIRVQHRVATANTTQMAALSQPWEQRGRPRRGRRPFQLEATDSAGAASRPLRLPSAERPPSPGPPPIDAVPSPSRLLAFSFVSSPNRSTDQPQLLPSAMVQTLTLSSSCLFGYLATRSSVTYPYAPQLNQSQPLPALSDQAVPSFEHDIFSPYGYGYDHGPLADQYRSTQLQSPTFSVTDSEASTTVSPRDVFADDHIAHKHYPSLFPPSRTSTSTPRSVETSSPRTPAEDQVLSRPSQLIPDRQPSVLSQSSFVSYASTSSEDEDAPTTMILPEPKGHGHSHSYTHQGSHSYPKHARSASLNNSTLSPSMALLATGSSPKWSPNGNNVVVGSSSAATQPMMHFGFKPLEPERDNAAEPAREQPSPSAAVYAAPIVPAAPFERKRGSPFGDRDDDDEDTAYRSSASDDEDDEEYTDRKPARRNSSAVPSGQRPKTTKKKVRASDPYARPVPVTRHSNGESSSVAPNYGSVGRESTPGEPTVFCRFVDPVSNASCTAGFVRVYDLKRVSSAETPTFSLPLDEHFTDWLRASLPAPSPSPQHEDTIHARASVPPATPGDAARPVGHLCEPCNRTFSRKDALIRHWKTIDHTIPVSQRRGPGGGGGKKR